MREAVIVSTARTPIDRAYRGSLNHIKSPTMLGPALRHAVQRAGVAVGGCAKPRKSGFQSAVLS